jgi:transcriptional regulator with XRE-family HTH domain
MAGRKTPRASESEPPQRFASGGTVRAIRLQAGVGVRELARRIGCSPGLISRIEGGTVAPSVKRLYAIANELGVSVDALLDGRSDRPRPERSRDSDLYTVVRASESEGINLPSGVVWRMLADGGEESVEFREVVYEPGAMSSPPGELLSHEGHEYGYVVDGRFELQIGDDVVELGPGDSIALPAEARHRLSNPGKEPARAVWLIAAHVGDLKAHSGDLKAHAARQAASHAAS